MTDDPEPLPWVRSTSRATSRSLPGLRYPLGSLLYGTAFIALAVWAAVTGLAETGTARVALLLIALIPAALGLRMIYIGARRWGWYRRFKKRHGHPPF